MLNKNWIYDDIWLKNNNKSLEALFVLYNYNHVSLEYLFEANSLKIFDAEIVDTKGGSLRFFVTHKESSQKIYDNIHLLKDIEVQRKLYEDAIYEEFGSKINIAKNKLLHCLDKSLLEGKKIIGYGASNTTTTLLYHFKLNVNSI